MFNMTPNSEPPSKFTYFSARSECHLQTKTRFPRRNLKRIGKYIEKLLIPYSTRRPFTSLLASNLSQILLWTQRFQYFLLSCLFLQSLEITSGEIHQQRLVEQSNFSPPSSSSSAAYLHHSVLGSSSSATTTTPSTASLQHNHPSIHSQQRNYEHVGNKSHFVRDPLQAPKQEGHHTASIIASSFRTYDSQQPPQEDSFEDGEEGTNSISRGGGTSLKKKSHGGMRSCETIVLKECLDGLPPMNATGIPSTHQAVNTACRIYDAGMSCFDNWAKPCLPEKHRQKVKTSIMGAHEMYTFLCKDHKFRNDYLKHGSCYKRLSPHWDDCSRQFVDGLRRNTKHNYTAFCCIRIEFFLCVSKYSSYSCNREASRFVMRMAETLVRSSIRTKSGDYCKNVQPEMCIPIVDSGAGEFLTSTLIALVFNFITVIMTSDMK